MSNAEPLVDSPCKCMMEESLFSDKKLKRKGKVVFAQPSRYSSLKLPRNQGTEFDWFFSVNSLVLLSLYKHRCLFNNVSCFK